MLRNLAHAARLSLDSSGTLTMECKSMEAAKVPVGDAEDALALGYPWIWGVSCFLPNFAKCGLANTRI